MPAMAAFGFWDSRYYEYKQKEALDLIDTYRKRGYPLDFFVVDTDWRVNGSHGYQISTKDFPHMAGVATRPRRRDGPPLRHHSAQPVPRAQRPTTDVQVSRA